MLRLRPGSKLWDIFYWTNCCRRRQLYTTRRDTSGLSTFFSFCQSFFILSACLCHSYCNTLLVSLMPLCVIAYQNFMPSELSVCLLVFFECSINFSVICSPILFCLFLFFPFTLHFFSSFFPCILLSAHTCGFCQFIIVKTNLTGSQRPVFNHTAPSFILLH